jgi:hypothetical protein
MENVLQYVWKNKLYGNISLFSCSDTPVEVIDPGILNRDAGPDFFNAKVRIGDLLWAGNIEVHSRASDWYYHKHDTDPSYDSVILHVVGIDDARAFRTNNEPIQQLVLDIPERILHNIDWLLSRDSPVSCSERLPLIPHIYISDWMTALLVERLKRKTDDITKRMDSYMNDWNEVFYITLMRNFGFGANADAFELLARSLPYKIILKHRNSSLQIEALLFGQSGLLDEFPEAKDNAPAGETDPSGYIDKLCREYSFLRKKYQLEPVNSYMFKKLRVRPVNFPYVRLAQLSSVFIKNDLLFSCIIDSEDLKTIRSLFDVELSPFWKNHYNFHHLSADKNKSPGRNTIDVILVNTVAPVLYAYGKYKNEPDYCERATAILEQLPPEKNSIVKLFTCCGIKVYNAGDSQSLIQLRREYCDKKKCLYCRIGFRFIDY